MIKHIRKPACRLKGHIHDINLDSLTRKRIVCQVSEEDGWDYPDRILQIGGRCASIIPDGVL